MEFTQFIRKPFVVQAVEITEENMEEVAQFIGQVRTKGDLTFIALDRRIVPNVSRAYVGWWLTILGENYRCYAPKVFNEQFILHESSKAYFFEDEDPIDPTPPVRVVVTETMQADPVETVSEESMPNIEEDPIQQ